MQSEPMTSNPTDNRPAESTAPQHKYPIGSVVRAVESGEVGIVTGQQGDPYQDGDPEPYYLVSFPDFYAIRIGGQSVVQALSPDDRGFYAESDIEAWKIGDKTHFNFAEAK